MNISKSDKTGQSSKHSDTNSTAPTADAHSVPKDFIEAHKKVCSITGKKVHAYTPESKHFGKRKFHTRNEGSRRNECAKKLYKECLELGIEPTPIREEYQKEYDRLTPPTNKEQK